MMLTDAAAFQALNPANGWGNYDGAIEFLRALLEACDALPDCIVGVSA